MHLVCHACGTINRVPDERLDQDPVCGRCGERLMAARPFDLNDVRFAAFIAGSDLPVVVDFWAAWCGPCQQMAPHFAEAAGRLPHVRFAKLDTEANPRTSAAYGIRSIPSLILFKGGKEAARATGAMSSRDLLAWLNTQLTRRS